VSALAGRPAIVTGAGRGVGRGIALALAAEGAPVAVIDRAEETLGDTCAEIEQRGGTSIPVVCDVRDLPAIERAVATVVDAFGGLRILVNNAQTPGEGLLLEVTEEDVDDAWRSGPLAAFRFMRVCHPHLRDGGAVVNVSSGAAMMAGPPGLAAYAAVKAALQTFSRAAAVEWGADGIRVNTIQPLASTPAYEQWKSEHPEAAAASLARIPVGRIGDPEHDVGRVVVFLVGPDAGMVSGTIVPVDGGSIYLR
jgi:NAD(P)-dependent dehydrogenase (short-subunit alcohol dehydrogenase family)